MKIKKLKESFVLEIKRMYLPIVLIENCPRCNKEVEYSLNDHYLSYPDVNKSEIIYFYCENCSTYKEDFHFTKEIKLKISVEEVI